MSKKPVAPAQPVSTRAERILGAMVISTIGLTILAFLSLIIGTGLFHAVVSEGIWPIIAALPLVGLPLAFVFMVSLLVLNFRRRRREVSGGSR